MSPSNKTIAAALTAFLAAAGITGLAVTAEDGRPAEEGPYEVIRVVDGDTVRVDIDGENTALRLIGMDTPETVHPRMDVECYGPEASAEAKRLLEGQEVYVITDPTQGNAEGKDHYGRLLSYVELEDGRDFAEHMILDGFAEEYLYDKPYERHEDYVAAEDLAQEADNGLWGSCPS